MSEVLFGSNEFDSTEARRLEEVNHEIRDLLIQGAKLKITTAVQKEKELRQQLTSTDSEAQLKSFTEHEHWIQYGRKPDEFIVNDTVSCKLQRTASDQGDSEFIEILIPLEQISDAVDLDELGYKITDSKNIFIITNALNGDLVNCTYYYVTPTGMAIYSPYGVTEQEQHIELDWLISESKNYDLSQKLPIITAERELEMYRRIMGNELEFVTYKK